MYTLGISETANELKIGKHTIYKIINEKNIKTYRVGRRVVFDSEQSKKLEDAVTEYKKKQSQVRSEATNRFLKSALGEEEVHTMTDVRSNLKIGQKRLLRHMGSLGIEAMDWGVAKVISNSDYLKLKQSIMLECGGDIPSPPVSENEENKANSVAQTAIKILKESTPKQQTLFEVDSNHNKTQPAKDSKSYSSLISKVTELTDENNALAQTLKERTEILERKKREIKNLNGEVEFLRKEYGSLKSYKEEMEEVFKNIKNTFKFLLK